MLPAVRKADEATLIIADGFSCREQIEQTTKRKALHLAQVLQMALHKEQLAGIEAPPEVQYAHLIPKAQTQVNVSRITALVGMISAVALGSTLVWKLMRKTHGKREET
jgi:hypothetical protein